jgi:hypothetical protein
MTREAAMGTSQMQGRENIWLDTAAVADQLS